MSDSEPELPEQFANEPVIGDGIVTLPPFERDQEMSSDLPPGVAAQLMTETVGNIQANNRDGRNAGTVATNVLAGAMARNFDELGTVEGRANSGVNATPIASPATGG